MSPHDWADLIRAIASLLNPLWWPLAAVIIVWLVRTRLLDMLGAARHLRAKVLGQEIELDRELDRVGDELTETREEIAALSPPDEDLAGAYSEDRSRTQQVMERVLDQTSLAGALVVLSREIERDVQAILQDEGHLPGGRYLGMAQLTRALESSGLAPPSLISALRDFYPIRNELVHGREPLSTHALARAIDYGLEILNLLQAMRRRPDRREPQVPLNDGAHSR